MSDWDLIIPGMGLTIIGMTSVGISIAGIARTFMEGMHALGMLVMAIGMIILATGVLKDGLPTSSRAKASVIVMVGFLVTFGTFMMSLSGVPSLPSLAGVLFLILVPATVIAYAAQKESVHFKAIAILFSSASAVGAIAFLTFGLVAPQPIEAGVIREAPAAVEEITGPRVDVTIPDGAQVEGNPSYEPVEVTVERGTFVVWTNADSVVHTVTSGSFDDPDFGSLFDSLTMGADATFALDTSELEVGEYGYFCTFHPFMRGKLNVVAEAAAVEEVEEEEGVSEMQEAAEERAAATEEGLPRSVTVEIVEGAADPDNAEFYVPDEITVPAGIVVEWINNDTEQHTVTSGGSFDDPDFGSLFDSGFPLMKTGERFEYTFDAAGEYMYFCQVHPFMVGKVVVT